MKFHNHDCSLNLAIVFELSGPIITDFNFMYKDNISKTEFLVSITLITAIYQEECHFSLRLPRKVLGRPPHLGLIPLLVGGRRLEHRGQLRPSRQRHQHGRPQELRQQVLLQQPPLQPRGDGHLFARLLLSGLGLLVCL